MLFSCCCFHEAQRLSFFALLSLTYSRIEIKQRSNTSLPSPSLRSTNRATLTLSHSPSSPTHNDPHNLLFLPPLLLPFSKYSNALRLVMRFICASAASLATTHCHPLPRTATCCYVLPRTATNCHGAALPHFATFCQLRNSVTCCHLLQLHTICCDAISLAATRCHLIPCSAACFRFRFRHSGSDHSRASSASASGSDHSRPARPRFQSPNA